MSSENQNGSLHTIIQNNIATVEFGHPASNSLTRTLLNKLIAEIDSLSKNKAITVIILRSEGNGVFCAGGSFDDFLAVTNEEEGIEFFLGFAHLINAMRNCSKIIIGRIQGKVVGGGVGIAAACDYAFATQDSSTKLSELAIGIGPFVIEPAVSRKIGKTAMTEMTLAAHEWKSAIWANHKGLFAKVLENELELDEELSHFALKLASYNPDALAEMKKVIWEGTENWDSLLSERARISGKLVLSDFTKKALAQFKN
ncbi:enoyl-CoA hydratase [Flavobacterium sp. KMS]|uniref:enoyl-CoA hydratase/isomerase family protein n=1 Tax=Flavobacterium sp. KMS TaxID=1566023 RepID=UPI00057D186D|nr:enoyl-CoA hydratase/isomerase family protein [Flavobacterium sp. KMS]KIA94844.1 enoyl-CoA hydratase [Flavobacterium sp. KMS]